MTLMHFISGCGRGTRRGQKSTVDEQPALLKTLVRGETVNFVDETKSEMEGQVLIVDKFQKSVTVSVEDGMITRRIPVNSLLVRSDDIAGKYLTQLELYNFTGSSSMTMSYFIE